MELAQKKVGLCLWRMKKGHRIDGTFQPHPSPVDLARVLDTSTHGALTLGAHPITVS